MTDSTQSPIWREHPFHRTIEVSDQGRVRSIAYIDARGNRRRARLRNVYTDSDGYPVVRVDGKHRKVHRLVLEAFVSLCPPGMEALHGDANPSNPALDNLRWGTPSENQLQRVADGNHDAARRTHCPGGHLLVEPNLSASGLRIGKRACLACLRGRAWARYHPGTDVQAACDRYYRQLID